MPNILCRTFVRRTSVFAFLVMASESRIKKVVGFIPGTVIG